MVDREYIHLDAVGVEWHEPPWSTACELSREAIEEMHKVAA